MCSFHDSDGNGCLYASQAMQEGAARFAKRGFAGSAYASAGSSSSYGARSGYQSATYR